MSVEKTPGTSCINPWCSALGKARVISTVKRDWWKLRAKNIKMPQEWSNKIWTFWPQESIKNHMASRLRFKIAFWKFSVHHELHLSNHCCHLLWIFVYILAHFSFVISLCLRSYLDEKEFQACHRTQSEIECLLWVVAFILHLAFRSETESSLFRQGSPISHNNNNNNNSSIFSALFH